jgi:tRNA/rRNA methyltransferase
VAGTDHRRFDAGDNGGGGPAIILVDPQLGENIGMAARAMLNCGLTDLRLVRPRDGWPNARAVATASGADVVLDAARSFETTEDAIADLTLVFAATTRDRDMIKRSYSPEQAAQAFLREDHSGVIFGGEAWGLHNDDIALAEHVITVPLNPGFSSLNLSQAVLLIGYEWYKAGRDAPPPELRMTGTRPASKKELVAMFEHLESALDDSGFMHIREKRSIMARNLRNMLQRAELTEKEVRTLRGVIASLAAHKPDE